MRLQEITLRTVRLPLIRPYLLSYRTFTEFEPIIVGVRAVTAASAGAKGISRLAPAAKRAKAAGRFAVSTPKPWLGRTQICEGRDRGANLAASKVAGTAMITAIEMLEAHPLLAVDRETRLPLLTPFNSSKPQAIAEEVERRLGEGFRTFKIKVGKAPAADLRRVQRSSGPLPAGRPSGSTPIALFPKRDACRFAPALDPSGIELFEQPCPAEDWEANAKVASVSPRSSDAGRANL